MTKKIVALALAMILFISCLPLSIFAAEASADDSITATLIYVESTHARPGEYVDVNVNIINNPGIAGAKFSLSFDEDLTLVSIEEDTGVFKALDFTAPENLSGTIIFTWDSLDEVSSTDGTILTLKFKVADGATANEYLDINISHNYGDIYNTELDSVTITTVSGRLLVIDYIPGDVNGDGVLNGKDVTLIRRYNAGLTNDLNLAAADVNDDGVINGKDVTLIRRFNADWDVELQPSTPKCNHSMTAVKAKEATCTVAGNIAYWHCSKCEKYFFDEAATIEMSLEETVIFEKGHTEVKDEAVPPTYDSTGLTEGSHCSVCGTVILAQQELPKKTKQTITYNDYKAADIPLEYWSYGSDEGLTLPEIEVEGYSFIGWSETKQLRMYKEDADIPSNLVVITSIDKGSTKDYKLYAHFMLDKYTITMRDLINDTETIEYTVEDSFEIPSPEWSGLLFAYWQDTSNKLVTYLDAVGKQRAKVEKGTIGDFEIIAKWRSPENLVVPKKSNAISASGFDEVSGNYWFFYELGEIQNVVLDSIITPQRKTANYTPKFTLTQTFSIEQEKADEISSIISELVSKSEAWGSTTEWAEKLMAEGSFSIKTGLEATIGKKDVASATASLETTVGFSMGAEVCDGGSTSSDKSSEIINEESTQINSSFSYKTTESVSEGLEYTIPESAPNGTYRYVHAADIAVYAIIIYDPETQTFVLDTHSVIDQTVAVLLFERDDYVEYAEETLAYNINTDDLDRLIDTAYFIQYAPMEGEGEIATTMHSIGQESKISNQSFKRTGYTQTGWTICKADGTEIEYKLLGANIHNMGLSGETLIAKPVWTANTYTINYVGNGANGGGTESSNHTYDASQALTANGFTRAYTVTYNHTGSGSADSVAVATWTFKEWYSENGTPYKDGAIVLNLKSTDGATTTMTALWNPASVTLPNPTRTGYTCVGWYTDTTYSTEIGNPGDSYTPSADITLYAKWAPNTYSITYDANGGTANALDAHKTKTYDSPYGELPTPTRTNCDFAGWYIGSTKVDSQTLLTTAGNHTLTAKWTPHTTGYWHSGSRDIEITTDGFIEYWQTGLNRDALKTAGYTQVEIKIKMNGKFISGDWFKADWWFEIYDPSGNMVVEENEEHWKTSWESREYTHTVSIDTIRDDGTVYVWYDHSGDGADDFYLGTVEIWTTAK